MKNKQPVRPRVLIWKQPKFGVDHFELWDGERLIGELYWTKWLSDHAVARCGQGAWNLDRVGCLRQRVVAFESQTGMRVASFEFGWLNEGGIHMANGRIYQWYRTKAFSSAWAIVDETDKLVYEIQIGTRWFKYEASVHLAVDKLTRELALLICLGLYLGVCTMQDAAAAVAATASVAAVM
jgi:hypothetical protein